jgi:hypothetical protein
MSVRALPSIALLAIACLLLSATAALGSSRGVLHAMSVAQKPISSELGLIAKCKAPTCFARHGRYLEADAKSGGDTVRAALRGKESNCARVAAGLYLDAVSAYRLAGHAFRFRHYDMGGSQITVGNKSLVAAAKRARRCI